MASAELKNMRSGKSITFLSINIKMLFKNQHPKQGDKACKENALPCHLSRSKHWMSYWKQNWSKMRSSLLQERKCRDVNKPSWAMKRKLSNGNGNAKLKVPEKPPEKHFDAQKLGMTHLFLLPNLYQKKSITMWAKLHHSEGNPSNLNNYSWFSPFSILNYDLEASMKSQEKERHEGLYLHPKAVDAQPHVPPFLSKMSDLLQVGCTGCK